MHRPPFHGETSEANYIISYISGSYRRGAMSATCRHVATIYINLASISETRYGFSTADACSKFSTCCRYRAAIDGHRTALSGIITATDAGSLKSSSCRHLAAIDGH